MSAFLDLYIAFMELIQGFMVYNDTIEYSEILRLAYTSLSGKYYISTLKSIVRLPHCVVSCKSPSCHDTKWNRE
jgi:hypothetical protein